MRNPKNNITISDLAENLSLSKATVSYVLTGRAEQYKIPAKTAKKVLQAAKALNYIPNTMARNFAKQSSCIISLLLGNLVNSWAHHLVSGISPLVQEMDYDLFLAIHNWSRDAEERELKRIAMRRDEGVLCQPVRLKSEKYEQVLSYGIPMVLLDAVENDYMSYVAWDSAPAAKSVTEHLIASGRRKIGFVGIMHSTITTRQRFEAYKTVLRDAGHKYREDFVFWLNQDVGSKETFNELISKVKSPDGPDALFVLNDGIAYEIIKGFYDAGIKVPDQISVAGMGDLDLSADFAVGLTTAREPVYELGKAAIELLFSMIKGETHKPERRWISCNELIVRKTT